MDNRLIPYLILLSFLLSAVSFFIWIKCAPAENVARVKLCQLPSSFSFLLFFFFIERGCVCVCVLATWFLSQINSWKLWRNPTLFLFLIYFWMVGVRRVEYCILLSNLLSLWSSLSVLLVCLFRCFPSFLWWEKIKHNYWKAKITQHYMTQRERGSCPILTSFCSILVDPVLFRIRIRCFAHPKLRHSYTYFGSSITSPHYLLDLVTLALLFTYKILYEYTHTHDNLSEYL